MTRETRVNLIFIIVICALMLPGAAMLFMKKLDPSEPPMYLPKPVRKSLAFNDPRSAPPQVTRVIGPRTQTWIATLAPAGAGAGSDAPPLMSQARTYQLLRPVTTADSVTVNLIVWNPAAMPDTPSLTWSGSLICGAQATTTSAPIRFAAVTVPPDVRRELQDSGYVQPPQVVLTSTAIFHSDFNSEACKEFMLTAGGEVVEFREAASWPTGWIPQPSGAAVERSAGVDRSLTQ